MEGRRKGGGREEEGDAIFRIWEPNARFSREERI